MNQKQREDAKKYLSDKFGNNCWGCMDEPIVQIKHLQIDQALLHEYW